jgi:3-oxoacyl-[acyl-carrier protein] reductase
MRNVIVTGGSRGLGLEVARSLCREGYSVIAVARTQGDTLASEIEAARSELRGKLNFLSCDLADIASIPTLISDVRKQFGPIFGLVNNAALGTAGVLATMPNKDIERLVWLNTVSPMVLTKYSLRSMMAHGSGRIVNIASIVALTGYSGISVYSATKASLIGFTRSLAREVGPVGITVNAVAPGFIETDMTHGMSPEQRSRIARRSSLRRLTNAEDVAAAVGFLMSESARNVTGIVFPVDAGSTA